MVGMPWVDHLALGAAVLMVHRHDAKVIVQVLHTRFVALFRVLRIETIEE